MILNTLFGEEIVALGMGVSAAAESGLAAAEAPSMGGASRLTTPAEGTIVVMVGAAEEGM